MVMITCHDFYCQAQASGLKADGVDASR